MAMNKLEKEFMELMENAGAKFVDTDKDLNWYSIECSKNNSLLEDNSKLVRGKNSKEALENHINKKVKRVMGYYEPYDYCVFLSNKHNQIYRDRRKRCYYKVIHT